MLLFMPLVLAMYCFCYKHNKNLPFIFIGVMSAVILCGIRMVFFYTHRVIPFSFEYNFFYFLIIESAVPVLLLYGLFLLFSKDEMKYKVDGFFPLEISFFLVYMPFYILTSSSGFDNEFSMILKPILYVTMITILGSLAREIYRCFNNKKLIWLGIICIIFGLLCLVVPAALESFYIIVPNCLNKLIIATVIYAVYPFVFIVVKLISKIFKNSGKVKLSNTPVEENGLL